MQGSAATHVTYQKVAELRSLETGRLFDCTVTETEDGRYFLDEEVERITGPFITFAADGSVALFKRLVDRRFVPA